MLAHVKKIQKNYKIQLRLVKNSTFLLVYDGPYRDARWQPNWQPMAAEAGDGGGGDGGCGGAAAVAGKYMPRARNAICCAGFTMSNLQMKVDRMMRECGVPWTEARIRYVRLFCALRTCNATLRS
jgi:hypothetical protein